MSGQLEKVNQDTQDQVNKMSTELRKKTDTCSSITKEFELSKASNKKMRERIQAQEVSLSSREEQLKEARSKLDTASTKLEAKTGKCENLARETRQTELVTQENSTLIREQEQALAAKAEDIRQLQSKLEEVTAKLAQVELEKKLSEGKLGELTTDLQHRENSLRSSERLLANKAEGNKE